MGEDFIQRGCLRLVVYNLPRGYTREELRNLLWTKIGWNAELSAISIKDNQAAATAFLTVSDSALSEFFTRNFADVSLRPGSQFLRFEPKLTKEEYERVQGLNKLFSTCKAEITWELPTGK
jgi:hypothetical protein